MVERADNNVFTPNAEVTANDKAIIDELKKLMRSANLKEQNH
jgi:hypothetical protein